MLAHGQTASSAAAESPPVMSAATKLILSEFRHFPTMVSDRRCNIVGWNEAAARVFMDFSLVPPDERNIIWILFTRKEFKALAVNWSDFVRGFLAIFRSYYGQYVGDPWYNEFIEKMGKANPEFRNFWNHNDVSSAPEVFIEFRHAKAGKMLFDLTSLLIQGHNDLRLSVYTPSAGSDTEEKMRQLMRKHD
jgi:hypothetical protein